MQFFKKSRERQPLAIIALLALLFTLTAATASPVSATAGGFLDSTWENASQSQIGNFKPKKYPGSMYWIA